MSVTQTIMFAPAAGRSCGTCNLCCTLVPVADKQLMKHAGVQCQHLNPKAGCRIYARRPDSCRWWSCTWLTDAAVPLDAKPSLTGVVFDCMGDTVIRDGERVQVVQAWCDPLRPEAWRHPAVMATIALYAETQKCPTLVRFNQERGVVVYAPAICADHQWHETWSMLADDRATFDKKLEEIGQ